MKPNSEIDFEYLSKLKSKYGKIDIQFLFEKNL